MRDNVQELEKVLQDQVDIQTLALSYGLEYGKLQCQVNKSDDIGADKKSLSEAKRNLSVLRWNQGYLQTARQRMRVEGNAVHFTLGRIP